MEFAFLMMTIKAKNFGRIPYLTGLQIQETIFNKLIDQHQESKKSSPHDFQHFICMFEHPPVYTIGIRERLYSSEEENRIKALGAEFHRVKRGGLITFHGPGQLVAYPIFNLRTLRTGDGEQQRIGVRNFVNLVEEVIIRMLKSKYGLDNAGRTDNPGVWLDGERKIAAMGIQVRHGITSHGLALNCNTDLKWFQHIVPCGLEGKSATSLSHELGRTITVADAIVPLCEEFEKVFGLPVELLDAKEDVI